ncbi:cysteine synthase B [Actinokineospora iranica]|uniref:Cysteine synthase B n=1 Tax=Actinokineospora iranica TaxID=1271860 RepID=A0A1G6X548_9PSEU|nr:cysteine synthase B [Actinokineospora iranica]
MGRRNGPVQIALNGQSYRLLFVVADEGLEDTSTGAYSGSLDEASERLDDHLWA